MEELKKCPFCGSDKVSVKTRERNYIGFYKYIVASVRCNICNARGSAVGEKIQLGDYGTEARGGVTFAEAKRKLINKAEEAWNNRV